MKKYVLYICTVLLISFLGFATLYAAGNKSTELKLKMTEITSLQQDLNHKIDLALQKKNQLEEKARELEDEIRDQRQRHSIESYQSAVLNPRIDYNLKLIQLLHGYIFRLNDKILYFKNGQDLLNFLFQQAQDDLLMIKTLNDLEIDKLIAQINELLDEYIPESRKPMFDVNEVPLKDTKLIWNEIIK